MKVSIPGFVHLRTGQYASVNDYTWISMKIDNSTSLMYVAPCTLEFELPEGFDPRSLKVDALKAEKIKLMADFQAGVTEIERKISELTCLEMS